MLELQGPGAWCFCCGVHSDLPGPKSDLPSYREVGDSALLVVCGGLGASQSEKGLMEQKPIPNKAPLRAFILTQMLTRSPLCHSVFLLLCLPVVCWEGAAARQASWRKQRFLTRGQCTKQAMEEGRVTGATVRWQTLLEVQGAGEVRRSETQPRGHLQGQSQL